MQESFRVVLLWRNSLTSLTQSQPQLICLRRLKPGESVIVSAKKNWLVFSALFSIQRAPDASQGKLGV
jgi:hypothetical protein